LAAPLDAVDLEERVEAVRPLAALRVAVPRVVRLFWLARDLPPLPVTVFWSWSRSATNALFSRRVSRRASRTIF
jgi:hypothetical protein